VKEVRYCDVLVLSVSQTKNGDQLREESSLMMSGIDHINNSDISDNSSESEEVKPKVNEVKPRVKQVSLLSF
jgi:hypothetical protein